MKVFLSLSDFLLVFWRTVVVIACHHQQTIIYVIEELHRNEKQVKKWYEEIVRSRDNGYLTPKDALLIQHEHVILEQLAIPMDTKSRDRLTFQHLSQSLYAESNEKANELCDRAKRLYSYFLIVANCGSDLYLNTCFASILQKNISNDPSDIGVCYNRDDKTVFALQRVHLVRGYVKNAIYCTTLCAINNCGDFGGQNCIGQTKNKCEHHTADCVSRAATWLLLTFSNLNNPEETRQIHCDVAAIAYGLGNFVGELSLPFHSGFFPIIEKTVYEQFETNGWPHRLLPSKKYRREEVDGRPEYIINDVNCVMAVEPHVQTLENVKKDFVNLVEPLRYSATLNNNLERVLKMRGEEKTAIYLISALKKHNISSAEAARNAFQMKAIVQGFMEGHNWSFFFDNMQCYEELMTKVFAKIPKE